jgi:ligand-binding sensor domain-containing protein/uncharacterized membrane protein YphA (DoxX/SURF4 family)
VNAFGQTKDGYLWLGTEEAGLIRFDGNRFLQWQASPGQMLPNNSIEALMAAEDGGLWIGTRGGLAVLRDRDLRIFTARDGLNVGSVTAIHEDRDGAVWVGTYGFQSGGLSRITGGHVETFIPSGQSTSGVSDILRDHVGQLWIAGQSGLIAWNANSGSVAYPVTSGDVGSLAESPDGGLWLTTSKGILRYFERRVTEHALLEGKTHARPRRILVDRDGGVWVGTLGQGLFHLTSGRIERMTHADGLSSDTIYALFEDREGNVWVGTSSGVDRFREYNVATWSVREGLPGSNVSSIVRAADGNLCAGIEAVGVYCFPTHHATYRLPNLLATALCGNHSGYLTVATDGGVFALSAEGRVNLSNELDRVYTIAQDRDQNLWFGDFRRGLFKFRSGQFTRIAADRFTARPISYLLSDREGRVWIALNPGGLTLYQNAVFRSFSRPDGLGSDRVVSLFEDHAGMVWVATDGGLSRYESGRFTTLTTQNGLPCDSVQDILEDDQGFLWLRTGCGLVRAKRSELVAATPKAGREIYPELFSLSDGFQPSTLPRGTTPRAAKTSDGRLWFIAGEGVAVVDPRHIARNMVPPPVHVEQIAVDGKAIDASRTASLPPTLERLQIDYTALSFTDPDRVFFKYKLDGLDKDWVDAGTRRQAFYTNLRPGRYQFRVIACNNDGVWNQSGATVSFNVESAFLQTRSFAWFCALAGMLFLNGIYYLRLHGTPALLMRNTIKSYPTGVPGLGLLLLRLAIGFDLLARSSLFNPFANNVVSGWGVLPRLLEITGGVFLIVGFATPIVGALLTSVVVLEMIQRAAADPAYASMTGPWENALLYVIVLGSLTLLGPGAISLDAKLFGQRRVSIISRSIGH